MSGTTFQFLSTLSLRRATHYDNYNLHCVEISIHALLAESDHYDNYNLHCVEISIHALLAESDVLLAVLTAPSTYFYPRSPCGERLILHMAHLMELLFLSTLSLRRATALSPPFGAVWIISIHALLAESDALRASRQQPAGISIHALLAESDGLSMLYDTTALIFLSTLSLRRATGLDGRFKL